MRCLLTMHNLGSQAVVLLFKVFSLQWFDAGMFYMFSPLHLKVTRRKLKSNNSVFVGDNNAIHTCFQIQFGIDRLGRNLNILEVSM